jgi:TPR repeat protein
MKKFFVFIFVLLSLAAYAQGVSSDLLKRANAGDPEAQNNLGVMYYNGEGVPQDYKRAAEWYLKAANQGEAEAQNNLGALYAGGDLGSPDIVTGCAWIYLSKDIRNSNVCDNRLNQAQMTRTLYLMEQIKKENSRIK